MNQIAVPTSDISTGSWTTTPIYSKISTPAPPDTTFVSSAVNPIADTFEVKLSAVGWPGAAFRLSPSDSNAPTPMLFP